MSAARNSETVRCVEMLSQIRNLLLRNMSQLQGELSVTEFAGLLRHVEDVVFRLQSPDSSDTRKSMRVNDMAVITARRSTGQKISGALYDLSEGGAAVAFEQSPNLGECLDVMLPVPDTDLVPAIVNGTTEGVTHLKFALEADGLVQALSKYVTRHVHNS